MILYYTQHMPNRVGQEILLKDLEDREYAVFEHERHRQDGTIYHRKGIDLWQLAGYFRNSVWRCDTNDHEFFFDDCWDDSQMIIISEEEVLERGWSLKS